MIRMTTLLSIIIVMVFCSPAWGGKSKGKKGASPKGKPFIEIQGQLIEVEGEIATLQDQVDALVGHVDSIEERVSADEVAIASLEATSVDLQSQIDTNAGDVASLSEQCAELAAHNVILQDQIDTLGDTDGQLQDDIDTNSALITALTLSITDLSLSLQDQIDNNSDLIGVLESELAILDEELFMKQNVIDGYCPDGAAISKVFPDGTVACEIGDFGTGPGVLNGYTTYDFRVLAPGSSGSLHTYCTEGYIPASPGYWAFGMDVFSALTSPVSGGYGYINATNVSSFDRYLYGFVTCLRVSSS